MKLKIILPYILIGFTFFCYIVIRGYNVDITFDEAWTIDGFSIYPFMDILNYSPTDANNHILNTLFIRLIRNTGGESVFLYRLPNILAFALFLCFAAKISHQHIKGVTGILAFIAIISNPFQLEFFSLARGYGLCLGFIIPSIYYLLNYLESYKKRDSHLSLAFATIAVIANFSSLNFWLSLYFVLHLQTFLRWKFNSQFWKFSATHLLYSIFLLTILYEPIRKLNNTDSLYYGGNSGFISDTLSSLIAYSIQQPLSTELPKTTGIIFLIFFYIVQILNTMKKNLSINDFKHPKYLLLLLLIIPIVSEICQFYLLGTKYLLDRTALFFICLFILPIFYSTAKSSNKKYKPISKIIAVILTFLLLLNTILHLNTYKTTSWEADSRNYQVLEHLNDIGTERNRKIIFSSSWLMHRSIDYYINQNIPEH